MAKIRWVFTGAVVLVAAVILGIAGCGSSSSSPDSGIIGLMTEVGGPGPGSPRPMSDVQIEVHRGDETGPIVQTTKSGADGTFTVALSPDRYTVVPIPLGDETVMPASVTVSPGTWTRVDVRFSVR